MVEPDANGWMPLDSAPRSDDDEQVWILLWDDFNKRRWVGHWDPDCGYFQGITCLESLFADGSRLYGATLWQPLSNPPVTS